MCMCVRVHVCVCVCVYVYMCLRACTTECVITPVTVFVCVVYESVCAYVILCLHACYIHDRPVRTCRYYSPLNTV